MKASLKRGRKGGEGRDRERGEGGREGRRERGRKKKNFNILIGNDSMSIIDHVQ